MRVGIREMIFYRREEKLASLMSLYYNDSKFNIFLISMVHRLFCALFFLNSEKFKSDNIAIKKLLFVCVLLVIMSL